ncbi:MAG: glycoside hydrolase, partial [Fibrobacter sp.]|nr:glycoside hydrolase [Fibrobacter sp.]
LRFTVTGDWMDIDYINFVEGKDADDSDPLAVAANLKFNASTTAEYDVFDVSGQKLASFSARNMAEAVKIWQSKNAKQGINMIRCRTTGKIQKVRSVH